MLYGSIKAAWLLIRACYGHPDRRNCTTLHRRARVLTYKSLIASVFLNIWKAVSAVVGDPSQDADYQRRYRELSLTDDFFQTRIESMRKLRNDYDVAHYTLDAGRLAQIEQEFGQSQVTTREVIGRYRERLTGR